MRALFEEEENMGWMEEVADEVAKERYGPRLFVAALAVIQEKEKIRVLHDGTKDVQVNNRIRVRDQVRSPGAGELRALFREWQERSGNRKMFTILGDASNAHRRVKVRKEDWGYQACRLRDGHVWLNKVGTYGLASTGDYWARLAAALVVRLLYYLVFFWGGTRRRCSSRMTS